MVTGAELLTGEVLLLAARLYGRGQKLLGDTQAAFALDSDVVTLLRESTSGRTRVVARKPGQATIGDGGRARDDARRGGEAMTRWCVPLLLAASVAAGCENRYEAITAPPPGLTASLDDESKSIRVSLGASIAFECTNQEGDPCARTASTTSASTALISFLANLDTLREWGYQRSPEPRTAFVVVGLAEGRTIVEAGGDSLSVTVLP